jgi:predicted nucleic acid-binding protein
MLMSLSLRSTAPVGKAPDHPTGPDAEIRAYLRRQGQLIEDFDILIAATALHHDLTLLTFNVRHFQRVPDLQIYTLP